TRESDLDRRLAAYELPRELEKLAAPVMRFLVEICRPMQIGVSPQLRGFYFVGARPVVVSDAAPASASMASSHFASHSVADATNVFSRMAVAAPVARPAFAPSVSRRVPQWVFLDRFFPQVVFADEGAAATARGGTRVARLRRGFLGVGIAATLLASIGIVRSAFGNGALDTRTTDAARAVAALAPMTTSAGPVTVPSVDALRRLDALGDALDTLRFFEANGVPMRLRFGLWHGGAVLATGRRLWFEAYRQQLHMAAWRALVDSLSTLPDTPRPTDDYGRTYDMLKAYLVMTAEPGRSTPNILAPQLLASWSRGQTLDADVTALARRQFEFYASELPHGNPWPQSEDVSVVQHVRTLLARFTGAEQIYQNMLGEANKAVPALNVAVSVPLAAGVLAGQPDVPGAFTAKGWSYMQSAFANADRYFQGERWVVGDAATISVQDRTRTIAELRTHYRRDYVQRWRAFVRALSVVRSTGSRDASQKLSAIASAQSPLLGELALVARNTAIDSSVAAAFQPVHAVTPPNLSDKYITDANQQYASALTTLQAAVEQIANMPPAQDSASASSLSQAGQLALGQATQAKVAARQMAQKFRVDTAAVQIGPVVAQLLEAPIDATEQVLRGVASSRVPAHRAVATGSGGGGAAPTLAGGPAGGAEDVARLTAALNERGRAFCSMMSPMLNKFPFTPEAQTDASLAEVSAMLAPGTGALWAFEHDRLDALIEKQGTQWVMRPDARVALSGSFLTFFNRAAQASAALFGSGADPHVAFTAHAAVTGQMPEVTLIHGTRVARFDRLAPEAQLVWPPAAAREAKLVAKFSGRFRSSDRTVAEATGDWALFHLVSAATVDVAGSTLHATWPVKDESAVSVDFVIASGFPVLRRGWLGGMACAPQVTR
ncbi:MAG TPA: ImcF-related family protein, partial [Gemmatimonadaceae bacterium]|nr:ImcF-related family protein [Gemmatimonadaceae bacterium]